MKFKYYITDIFDGRVKGTNLESVAKEFACCEDFFVVDAENGYWMQEGGAVSEIQNVISDSEVES